VVRRLGWPADRGNRAGSAVDRALVRLARPPLGNNPFMSVVKKSPLLVGAEGLERWGALDPAVETIRPIVEERIPDGPVRDALRGRWLGHALHPLLTDVPIGAWTSSLILDLIGGSSAEQAADLLVAVGVAAAGPTALTGWADWGETKTIEQRRIGIVHAASNITATTMFVSSLRLRRKGRGRDAGRGWLPRRAPLLCPGRQRGRALDSHAAQSSVASPPALDFTPACLEANA
jgi:hypothetical protein